ncbi:Polyketide cyclase / dehydrase and lipid transport [Micromonospora halophytica]|uniref:Polyketide cyclase / dehydrase and lipid transport n=2 Tax=Micromonospora halophytica TaxID=47864 RepID=A0A1C5IJI6_9ACTN|nr:Polyketide cyclase / dehydrase and lipid transport [Micromonospora halophytica]
MRNVQQRVIAAPANAVGRVIDELATPESSAWPSPSWPPLVLDNGLQPGSSGGHGPIRYSVTSHEPGRHVVLTFAPSCGLDGWHELRVTPESDDETRLVHTISATTTGRMRWLWPLVVRWFHEALVHDLFDNAERRVTGTPVAEPARWSPWVRLMRRVRARRSADASLADPGHPGPRTDGTGP